MYFLYSQRLRTSVSFVVSNFGLTFALRYASAQFKLRLALLGLVVNHLLSNYEVCSGTIKIVHSRAHARPAFYARNCFCLH